MTKMRLMFVCAALPILLSSVCGQDARKRVLQFSLLHDNQSGQTEPVTQVTQFKLSLAGWLDQLQHCRCLHVTCRVLDIAASALLHLEPGQADWQGCSDADLMCRSFILGFCCLQGLI